MTSSPHYRALAAQLRGKASHERLEGGTWPCDGLPSRPTSMAPQTSFTRLSAVARVLIAVARPKTIGGL